MPSLAKKFKDKDGRNDNVNRKEMLRDYIQELAEQKDATEWVFCSHTLAQGGHLPIKPQTIGLYLGDFEIDENGGFLEMIGKHPCQEKNYPHKKYRYVKDAEKREKLKRERQNLKNLEKNLKKDGGEKMISKNPTQERVFDVISSRFDVGDEFVSNDIRQLWKDEHKNKISPVINNLTKTPLIEVVKKRDGKNIFKLKSDDYEDRLQKNKEAGIEGEKMGKGKAREEKFDLLKEEFSDDEFCIHDVREKFVIPDKLIHLARKEGIAEIVDEKSCSRYSQDHYFHKIVDKEEEEEEVKKGSKGGEEEEEKTIEVKVDIHKEDDLEEKKMILFLSIMDKLAEKL